MAEPSTTYLSHEPSRGRMWSKMNGKVVMCKTCAHLDRWTYWCPVREVRIPNIWCYSCEFWRDPDEVVEV